MGTMRFRLKKNEQNASKETVSNNGKEAFASCCAALFAFDSVHYIAVPFVSAVGLFEDRYVMYSLGRKK